MGKLGNISLMAYGSGDLLMVSLLPCGNVIGLSKIPTPSTVFSCVCFFIQNLWLWGICKWLCLCLGATSIFVLTFFHAVIHQIIDTGRIGKYPIKPFQLQQSLWQLQFFLRFEYSIGLSYRKYPNKDEGH